MGRFGGRYCHFADAMRYPVEDGCNWQRYQEAFVKMLRATRETTLVVNRSTMLADLKGNYTTNIC